MCISSAVCDFLISAVWRKLTNKGCASNSVWDWVKREVKLLKCWNRLSVIRAWAVAELLSGLEVSRSTTSTANDDRSGRPSMATTPSKVAQVRAAVNQDRRRIIHDLCAEVGIGYGSCQRILTEQLNVHRIAAKFVPRMLTQDQKDSRVAIYQELKETVINDPTLLLNVIIGDGSIVYAYDPKTKLQSSQWKSPGSPVPKKARMQKAN